MSSQRRSLCPTGCGLVSVFPGRTFLAQALDESLKALEDDFGKRAAAWVALPMQYPGWLGGEAGRCPLPS
ncbi:hypothetical protein F3J19_12230 [Burkholderia sp. Ax-1724]|nr:hypothetical protein [Burkholderia sp. Ax-1724]